MMFKGMNPQRSCERGLRMISLCCGIPPFLVQDLATQLYDQNVLRFIPLEKCYSRLTELAHNNKPQSKLVEVEASKVVIREKDNDFESGIQSSYQGLEAFKRRGLALDFANVMSFTNHDKYVQLLFAHKQRSAIGIADAVYHSC